MGTKSWGIVFLFPLIALWGEGAVAQTSYAPSDPFPIGLDEPLPPAPGEDLGPPPLLVPPLVFPFALPALSADIPLGPFAFNFDEPLVRVDPTAPSNVVVTSHNGMRISTDFGQTFAAMVNYPVTLGSSNGDTAMAFDSQGRLFWANLVNQNDGDLQVMQVNPTTGATIAGPVNVQTASSDTGLGFDDKEFIAADEYAASPYTDNLYMIWTKFGATWDVYSSRSNDQGVTWSLPLQLSNMAAEGFPWPSDVAVAPNGDVYTAYHSGGDDGSGTVGDTWVLRSTDGGVTFPQKNQAFTAGQSDVTFNVQSDPGAIPLTNFWMQGSVQPWVLPDPARPGNVYVINNDDPDDIHGSGDDADVVIARSTDNGGTWAVSTIPDGGGTSQQVFPFAAIDENGNIVVAWYDTRAGATNANDNLLLDVYATYSVDGGVTWATAFQVNDINNPFDPEFPNQQRRWPTPQQTPCDVTTGETCRIGEYFAIDINGGSVYLAWEGNTFDVGGAVTGDQLWFDRFVIPADLSIIKTDEQDTAAPGAATSYTIEVSNNSTVDVRSATVTDTFTDLTGVTWVCAASAGSSCTAAGTGNISDLVDIMAGGTLTYTVNATISLSATGTLSNTASVSSPVTDEVPGNNSATDTTELVSEADLEITKTDNLTEAVPGQDTITYEIIATNHGPSDNPSVNVTDTFPAALTCAYVSTADIGVTGNTASGSGNISDTGMVMPADTSITYIATCTIDPSATGTLSNTANIISASVTDPGPGPNSAADNDTLLTPVADLAVTKIDNHDPITAGEHLTYGIVITNNGPSDAQNVIATEILPPEVAFIATTGDCSNNPTGVPDCQLGTIAVGDTKNYSVLVYIDLSLPDTTITNEVSVSTSAIDPNNTNDSAREETMVRAIFAIPTLSAYGLAILVVLLGFAGYRRRRAS